MATPVLSDGDIVDLMKGTQHDLGRNKFTHLFTDLQDHEAAKRIMVKDRMDVQGGDQIQRNLGTSTGDSGNARQVGLFQTDNVSIPDLLQQIKAPWKHTVTEYAWERREALIQIGNNTILSVTKLRRAGALSDQCDHFESQFWNKPTSSSNELDVWGLPYWVVSDTTTAAGSFGGGIPTGFSDVGGISPTTYDRWKNWTFNFSSMNQECLRRMRKAYRKIGFKNPTDDADYRKGRGDKMRIYMDEETIDAYEDLIRNQNENLGNDAAKYLDETVFKRSPVVWVPYLDDNAPETNPIYFINYDYFCPVFLRGDALRESDPDKAPDRHNVFVIFIDTTWNMLCTDRRRQAVGTKV